MARGVEGFGVQGLGPGVEVQKSASPVLVHPEPQRKTLNPTGVDGLGIRVRGFSKAMPSTATDFGDSRKSEPS